MTGVSVSKVLHLIRPRFVAISDSYVRRCLGIDELRPGTTDRVDTLMAVQRGTGGLAKVNKESLDDLVGYAGTLPPVRPSSGESAGQDSPVRLSRARILDVILWSDVAILDERHQHWSHSYAEEVPAPNAGFAR